MSDQRIRELARKWINGTITAEEREAFLQWYNNADDGTPLHIPESFAPDELTHGIRILSNIYERVGMNDEPQKAPTPFYSRRWVRIAAMWIVLAGLGMLVYNLTGKKQQTQAVVHTPAAPPEVKAPAAVQAVIRLEDGSTIVLDSLATGTVAAQGGATFTKVEEGQIVYQPISDKQVFSTLVNPRGSRVIQVTLADGTRVWLNSESSIRYPNVFTGNVREVEVTGQTYFEVARNETMPFVVRKGNTHVRVLGTHFDVNAYDDEDQLAVTLLEGSVRVSNGTLVAVQLKAGEQSQLDRAGKLSKVANVDVDKVIAWKNGRFDFGSKTDIVTILKQITRWYDLELEFNGPREKYYGGTISRDVNLSEVLKVLETAGNVKFEVQGHTLKVLQ